MSDSIRSYAETKEYIVTLKSKNDLDSFYNEMENKGKISTALPDREVLCIDRRPSSRNTHYILTELEAKELKKDPRVKEVSLHPRYLGIKAGLNSATTTQTSSNWNKSGSTSNTMLNWGLLRCSEGVDRSGWGSNGTVNQTGTVNLTSTGKNVDVVIIDDDGLVDNHPEYAVNADSTGGSRYSEYNWFQHNPAVKGTAVGNYVYGTGSHSTHVAGTVAGTTQGWARDANIYNIYYLAGDNSDYNFPYVMDYVREFHRTKSVNPSTGRKNPTITNNSWGMSIFPSEWTFSDITAVTYRGTRYTPPGSTPTYTGYSGVCTSSERKAQLAGLENFGNRITTSGTGLPGDGTILSKPGTWAQEGQQAYLVAFAQPDATYQLTVQGPASIDIINNVAIDAISGSMSISNSVVVKDSSDTVIQDYTDGPVSTTNGGTIEVNIRNNGIQLPNSEVYTIEFNNTVDVSGVSNPTFATALSLTCTDVTTGTATITEITNQLLGAASLTESIAPDVAGYVDGGNDDGYWLLPLPFSIEFFGSIYNTVYVSTNGLITFSEGTLVYEGFGPTTPNLPKIMWGAADNSVQRIYYGTEGADTGTYTVTNSGASAYTINSSSNPTLTLKRGGTYTFNVSASGHPFWIKTFQTTGTEDAYNTGVTNNGTDSGTITFTVPDDAPSTLYYICQIHGVMSGTINVVSGTRTYRIRVEGNAATSGTLGNPGMISEYVFYEATPNQIDLQLGATNRKGVSGGGFTTGQLQAWGFVAGARIPKRVPALDADIEDAMAEGIIYVGAAGNGYWKHDVPGGLDWNNTFEMANRYPQSVTNPYYYMRGSSPTANDDLISGDYDLPNISVGSIDVTTGDYKATYSDCGPGIDIFAPGTSIISSFPSGVSDGRNSSFFLGKLSGTSMASPNVCGVLACALEQNPHWNQVQAKAYITGTAKTNQITATTGGPADYRDLQGAPNKYLYYKKERPSSGLTVPKPAPGPRPSTGMLYPRNKIRRSF